MMMSGLLMPQSSSSSFSAIVISVPMRSCSGDWSSSSSSLPEIFAKSTLSPPGAACRGRLDHRIPGSTVTGGGAGTDTCFLLARRGGIAASKSVDCFEEVQTRILVVERVDGDTGRGCKTEKHRGP